MRHPKNSRLNDDNLLAEPLLAMEANDVDDHNHNNHDECSENNNDDDSSSASSSTTTTSTTVTTKPSRNIPLILSYTFMAFVGRSIWSQSVLSTFVYFLKHENPEAVGFITAIMGMCQLFASVPSGMLADAHRRDYLLKLASVLGLAAVVVTLIAIQTLHYTNLAWALALHGCFWGIANTSLVALFADSIQDGDRSYYFTRRSILIKFANTTGPLTALVLFAMWGDEWTLQDCAHVMMVGQCMIVPSTIILCFLSDDHIATEPIIEALMLEDTEQQSDDEEEAEDYAEEDSTPNNLLIRDSTSFFASNNLAKTTRNIVLRRQGRGNEEATGLNSSTPSSSPYNIHDGNEDTTSAGDERLVGCIPSHRTIPILIAITDVCSGLGAGMSTRYFPIFFVKNLNLSPVMVQLLYIVSPLCQAVLMHQGQQMSKREGWGRCRVAAALRWFGMVFMILMILSYTTFGMPVWVIAILYVLRTSFMNSTQALTKSVLMDNVPKRERGKWSALESVNMFSWSGSAALGGILVGYEGIIFNFCITTCIQFIATMPLVLLFQKDQEQEGTVAMREGGANNNGATTALSRTVTATTDLVDRTEASSSTSTGTS